MTMRCHYEVLEVQQDAASKDIKRAFHVQALKWHPDKHQSRNVSHAEATERFQEIQAAYEVLSDPHERQWYDDHREQILRGDDEQTEEELNLFKYFSPSIYKGFGTDRRSFYTVYHDLFLEIDRLDADSHAKGWEKAPAFGDQDAGIDDVLAFYRHWEGYVTKRTFAWLDQYKTTDGPTRQVRRAMEKENQKVRDAAKKAFTSQVRELVEFIKKRDPRMIQYVQEREERKRQQQLEKEERQRKKKEEYEAQRKAFQEAEEARLKNEPRRKQLQQEEEEELEKWRRRMNAEVWKCDVCQKSFKSEKQVANHLDSKKHRDKEKELGITSDIDAVDAAMEAELQAELAAMALDKHKQTDKATDNDKIDSKKQEEEEREEKERADKEEAARIRQEKEARAALKRKERKEKRKAERHGEVEKIVTAARDQDDDDDDGKKRKGKGRRRGKK